MNSQRPMCLASDSDRLYKELWVSLASLLRSYTAVYGLHSNLHAAVESTGETISVRYKEKSLFLQRDHAILTWTRENGTSGRFELSETGRLRTETSEEEMDMAAEAWARELMQ